MHGEEETAGKTTSKNYLGWDLGRVAGRAPWSQLPPLRRGAASAQRAPRAPARRPPSWPHVRLRLPAAKPPHARLPARRPLAVEPLTQLPPPPPPPDASVWGCRWRSGFRDRNRPKRTRETVTSVRDVLTRLTRSPAVGFDNDREQFEGGSPSVYDPTSRRLGLLFRPTCCLSGSGPIHATRPRPKIFPIKPKKKAWTLHA